MNTEILVSAIGAAGVMLGAVVVKVSDLLIARAKALSDIRLAEAKQPVEQYAEIVQDLRGRITALECDVEECSKQHRECERTQGHLQGQVATLTMLLKEKVDAGMTVNIKTDQSLESLQHEHDPHIKRSQEDA